MSLTISRSVTMPIGFLLSSIITILPTLESFKILQMFKIPRFSSAVKTVVDITSFICISVISFFLYIPESYGRKENYEYVSTSTVYDVNNTS